MWCVITLPFRMPHFVLTERGQVIKAKKNPIDEAHLWWDETKGAPHIPRKQQNENSPFAK